MSCTVTFAQLSDRGRVRSRNEDCSAAFAPADPALLRRRGRLFVVADGMGGHAHGEMASRLAVETVHLAYYDERGTDDVAAALSASLRAANDVLYRQSERARLEPPMGTTLTSVVVRDAEAFVAHVGDSRAYLIRGRRIAQLTEDHSLVSELVRQGVLDSAEAEHHPSAHVVLRAIGTSSDVSVELHGPMPLMGGDTLVLCTDGLSRLVSTEEIRRLAPSRSPIDACERLVSLANERGGPDNITLQVIRIEGAQRPGAGVNGVLSGLAGAARWWRRCPPPPSV